MLGARSAAGGGPLPGRGTVTDDYHAGGNAGPCVTPGWQDSEGAVVWQGGAAAGVRVLGEGDIPLGAWACGVEVDVVQHMLHVCCGEHTQETQLLYFTDRNASDAGAAAVGQHVRQLRTESAVIGQHLQPLGAGAVWILAALVPQREEVELC